MAYSHKEQIKKQTAHLKVRLRIYEKQGRNNITAKLKQRIAESEKRVS